MAAKKRRKPRKTARKLPTQNKLFLFNWVGGGYNSVTAKNKKEALKLGNEISSRFKVDERTLHEGTYAERHDMDSQYR